MPLFIEGETKINSLQYSENSKYNHKSAIVGKEKILNNCQVAVHLTILSSTKYCLFIADTICIWRIKY